LGFDPLADATGPRGLADATMSLKQLLSPGESDGVEIWPKVIEPVNHFVQELSLLRGENVGRRNSGEQ